MQTIEHLRELFRFNDWANRKVLVALTEAESAGSLALMAHLLITEREYFKRLYGKDSTGFDFWPTLTVDECRALARENAENFERLLGEVYDDGLENVAGYKTSEGVSHENTFREMLTHVLFHSMTHRGQVLTAMRADGIAPPKIDYIIYLRENS